jgi:hypothetical protein
LEIDYERWDKGGKSEWGSAFSSIDRKGTAGFARESGSRLQQSKVLRTYGDTYYRALALLLPKCFARTGTRTIVHWPSSYQSASHVRGHGESCGGRVGCIPKVLRT